MSCENVYWMLLVLVVGLTPVTQGVDYCSVRAPSWNSNPNVRLSLFTSLRKADTGHCGEILPDPLQSYVAVAWVVDKLNQGDGFIPGVRFGFELFDDCQSPLYTARNALNLLGPSLSQLVTECNSSDSSLHLGVIGPSRSETAAEAADFLKSSHIPLISPSATVRELSNKTLYPNFLRTALPDTVQIEPVLDILLQLDWTYVVVVHSDDIYGRAAAAMLQTKGRARGVCFIRCIEMSIGDSRPALFEDLRAVQDNTQDGTLGVVYFGMWDVGAHLMDYYARSSDVSKLHWLMSDSVGRVRGVFQDTEDAVVGTLTLSPATTVFQELKDFWTHNLSSDSVVQKYLMQAGSTRDLMNITQSDYVAATVDAIYAYAVALKNQHEEKCKGQRGMCDDLRTHVESGDYLLDIKNVKVNYSSLNAAFVPPEYIYEGRVFSFNESGDIVRSPEAVLYEVNSFQTSGKYVTVGTFRQHGLTLNKTAIRMMSGSTYVSGEMLPKSLCRGICKECVDFGQVPMVFMPGDVYIVGVFSLHAPSEQNQFQCGSFRNLSSDTVALEAFIFSVKELRNDTGINFGAVAFDDCYNPIRLTSIISEYFSAIGNPTGVFSNIVLLNKTVAVVGSLSSGSTIPLTRFFNDLNIPAISYASSTPDLDDRVNFPYFLRTVPSDVEQAKAMVEVIQAMGWEYVSLVYVDNNYGTKGMLAFKSLATKNRICVSEPKPIPETSGDSFDSIMYNVVKQLVQEEAKVVVFFGIDTRFEKFVSVVEEEEQYGKFIIVASEDWGDRPSILDAGRKASRGSITLKLELIRTHPFSGFENNLLSKTVANNKDNPWFDEFWQHEFKCDIRGGFNNQYHRECTSNERLSKEEMQNHFDDQRVSHVQYATYAAGKGVEAAKEKLCDDAGEFPCRFYYDPRYSSEVWEAIREVKNPKLESFMFDDDGNGAMGFTIYNVQKDEDTTSYVEVGTFGKNGLNMNTDNIKFYTELGEEVMVEAKCGEGSRCSMCEFPPTSSVGPPEGESGVEGDIRITDIIIIAILALVVILLIIVVILAYRYFRKKLTGLTKEIQRNRAREPDHIYQAVSDVAVYQNKQSSPDRRPVPAPQHIYFVNGSQDSLRDVGHDNQAFRAEDTLSQRNVSGGSVANTAVTNSHSSPSRMSNDSSGQPQSSVSPSGSGQLAMTEVPASLSPVSNGQIPNGSISSPNLPRPSNLPLHQNPRFVDMRQLSMDNGSYPTMVSPVHMVARPDLQHMPETYMGSPLSSMSPGSETRQPQIILGQQTPPMVMADPSLLQTLANQQAMIDQQTALDLHRLQLLQHQQNALNQHLSNPYIPLNTTESIPRHQHFSQPASPPNHPRPRTNPHAPNNLNRVLTHHGSVDSLRSSGRSLGTLPNIQTRDSIENIPENIPLQSLGQSQESRISRV